MTNTRKAITLIATGIALLTVSGCEFQSQQTIPENVIVIGENYGGQFNADAGDTLILVMDQDADWIQRCYNYGGEPILNTRTNIATCEDVDF